MSKFWRVIDLTNPKIVFLNCEDGLRICLEKGEQRYVIRYTEWYLQEIDCPSASLALTKCPNTAPIS